MKKTKIKTKMVLLFTGLSVMILFVLIPSVYGSIAGSYDNAMNAKFESAFLQIATDVEEEHGKVVFKKDRFDDGVHVYVEDRKENKVYSTDKDFQKFSGDKYLLRTKKLEINELKFTASVAISKEDMNRSLTNLRLILLAFVPFYLAISALGAYIIANKSLKPITRIAEAAEEIGKGDLSRRIEEIETDDEVGDLSRTFNSMLDQLEVSFQRERRFTSDASHELRTPISVISACIQDVLDYPHHGDEQESLEMIQTECKRMNKMVSQLLMLSRGYEGRIRVENDELSLYEIAEMVSETLHPQAEEKNITLSNEIPKNIHMQGDLSLMTQMFINLTENSVKYGREGGKTTIRAAESAENITIEFFDDGIGIREEDLPYIFERFYRADKARGRQGTGLGLAIVKWIANLHGGTCTAESKEGEYTKFIITIPKNKE